MFQRDPIAFFDEAIGAWTSAEMESLGANGRKQPPFTISKGMAMFCVVLPRGLMVVICLVGCFLAVEGNI